MPHTFRVESVTRLLTRPLFWLVVALLPFGTMAIAADGVHDAVYLGKHRLGANRVTDDERVGLVEFSKRDGGLYLKGRVARGTQWLELEGAVEVEGPLVFHLQGVIRGVPQTIMDETPGARSSEARFTFKVRGNRKFWRLYLVDGQDCVCGESCGNDFCYIDIERAVLTDAGT